MIDKYDPAMVAQVQKLCELGATDFEICDFLDIGRTTLWRWTMKYPAFAEAMKTGKAVADERVERSLYARAVGYSHDAVKIMSVSQGGSMGAEIVETPYVEHVPPDVVACIFWLKNRRPDLWRDKSVVDHNHNKSVEELTDAELAAIVARGAEAPGGSGKRADPPPGRSKKPH